MRYPKRLFVIVSDAEANAARALVKRELGEVRGEGWFGVKLKNVLNQTFWASSSVVTDANVDTIAWFQNSPNALTSLKYVVSDCATGKVTKVSDNLNVTLGLPLLFNALTLLLGLTIVFDEGL